MNISDITAQREKDIKAQTEIQTSQSKTSRIYDRYEMQTKMSFKDEVKLFLGLAHLLDKESFEQHAEEIG